MLLIYIPYITKRIEYTMHYVFEERLGIQYKLINDKQEYITADNNFKIAYSNEYINAGIYFFAYNLLFEDDIKEAELYAGSYKNLTTLYTHDKPAALNFDIFSAVFYLLSRYEEYLNKPADKHGNYIHSNSILYKLDLLNTPVIEQWLEVLKEVLLKIHPSLLLKNHKAKFALTFDIDIAYAYKHKGFARTTVGFLKRMITLNFNEAKEQLFTLFNKRQDIFDTYNYIFSCIKNKKPVFFFDMGDHGKFDKNPSYKNRQFRQLIKSISAKAVIGVHPSYASNSNKRLMAFEKNKLEQITGQAIQKRRQHYLKLKLPATYSNLINNNIQEDFTIGYAAMYGFRAGTCNSFLYFNLEDNSATNLRLYPFAYMDVTLNNYLNLSIDEAKKVVSKLIDHTVNHKGIFIPLWHNSTLCNCNEWSGWREVFEHTLNEIDKNRLENLTGEN